VVTTLPVVAVTGYKEYPAAQTEQVTNVLAVVAPAIVVAEHVQQFGIPPTKALVFVHETHDVPLRT